MKSKSEQFNAMHRHIDLFVLPNAWDARSALIFQEHGYRAVATSSAAVANSLGYEDGEQMSFDEYLFVVRRIMAVVDIPVTVDIEMGYGNNADQIAANANTLAELGVSGINIEDSVIENKVRRLGDPIRFAKIIEKIRSVLDQNHRELFINVRCDTYLLNVEDKQRETAERIPIYRAAGANGIFLPCIAHEADIESAVSQAQLPVNVMCVPDLPDFDVLNKLGVKRVSMGPFMFQKVYGTIGDFSSNINRTKNFRPLFSK